jgi:hypothetical protein
MATRSAHIKILEPLFQPNPSQSEKLPPIYGVYLLKKAIYRISILKNSAAIFVGVDLVKPFAP